MALATVANKLVVVAFTEKSREKRPCVAKKLVVVAFVVVEFTAWKLMAVVEPKAVSTEKTEVEAAFKILKATPFTGVWSVVVAP